tara:strand:+ start:6091 stop:6267 length:177 start_codon:yes stop_codon:yes gene_type:complete
MTDNEWPMEADFTDIRPMTHEERQRAREKEKANNNIKSCVSCGNPAKDVWCHFCMGEE